jgi:SAM-dependent methyltransferase
MTTRGPISEQVRRYYESRLTEHGATARGVDWNSETSQQVRFRDLVRLFEDEPDASILDYGCGYGALAAYIRARGHRGPYSGFDVSDRMIAAARAGAFASGATFSSRRTEVVPADYTVASGVFNVRQQTPEADWHTYVLETLDDIAACSRRGFGFNVLSTRSDAERRRADLFYADPIEMFDYCTRRFSRRVALLHDAPLYEFTMLVRL